MPTLLSDPTLGIYLAVLVVALIAGGVWFRLRTRRTLDIFVVALLALLLLFGIDRACESPREEAVRKVRAMATAANARDWPGVGTHVSEKFDFVGMTKARFLVYATTEATQNNAAVNLKDFDRDNFEEMPGGRVRIGFVAQISTPGVELVPLYVEAEFVPDSDGAYRMQKLAVYNYITRKKGGEQPLPGR